MHTRLLCLAAAAALLAGQAATAAEITPAAKKVLKNLKLTEKALEGLDAELAVPDSLVEAAKKEGKLKVRANLSPANFKKLQAVFQARYPFVKDIEYTRGIGMNRAVNPLLAFKRGNYVTDVITSFTRVVDDYREAKALARIDDLPTWKNIPDDAKDKGGTWISTQNSHWCMAYNTKRVKKEELPKTWRELIDNPRWHNGKIGMGNRPQLWLVTLWAHYGEAYGKEYIEKLFSVAKPQLRKEAINGLMKLAVLGEYDIALPAADYRVKIQVEKGAPLGFHCPDVVPTTDSQIGVFNGSPNVHAGRLFVNWMLSKEGQLALKNADKSAPAHEGLQREEFLAYPKEVLGKTRALRSVHVTNVIQPQMLKVWNKAWAGAGGPDDKAGKKKKGVPQKR